jgi:RNA polymerase sigma-70 factor (ECF subfamily)
VTLAAAFLAAASGDLAARAARRADLEALLGRVLAAARRPGVALDDEVFAAYLGARATADDLDADLATLHLADLWLACACAAGLPAALAALDRLLAGDAAPAARAVDVSAAFVDEVLQGRRRRLLVAEAGAPPRIASYSGSGPLSAWLRVAATRTALSLKRAGRREVPLDELPLLDAARGPESGVARADGERRFRAALARAMAALAPRPRGLLQLYHLDGLGVEELGRLHGVHASTISRWLQAARDSVLAATREALLAELSPDEAESLLGHAGSMEITIERFLRGGAD